MSNLVINSPFATGVTIIPNDFIDHYMSQANGEFVKIYLYLLRHNSKQDDLGLGTIADNLDCTEKDVLRALRYWAKEGLLELTYGSGRKLEAITFLMPVTNETRTVAKSAASVPAKAPSTAKQNITPAAPTVPAKPAGLTADKVKQLKENEEIAQLLFIAQQYLGKTLSPMETSRILYFYDGLDFSTDLIEYLIEYCVCRGHKSLNYIEKVALAWKEEGIKTVAAAKKNTAGYQKDYYTILKALGVNNRAPIDAEVKIMDVWMKEYGFSAELITEACTRTILATNQPSLQYTDKILASWKAAGVKEKKDILNLDQEHANAKSEKTTRKPSKNTSTHFSNFDERSYDYSALESQLLKQ